MGNKCIVCKNELEKDIIIVGDQFPSAIFANKNGLLQISKLI